MLGIEANVPYRDAKVAQHFGDANRSAARESYRGKAEAGRGDLAKTDVAKSGGEMRAKSAAKTQSIAHTDRAGKGKPAAHARQSSQKGKTTGCRSH